jgi:hypothetical protein
MVALPGRNTSAAVDPLDLATKRRARREIRAERLRRLGFKDYDAYLRSPQWASLKARYRASDLPQACVLCDEELVQLHHVTYERVGEELTDLAPL